MRIEEVEIFSDKTNSAVMRHPDRAFPGVLLQGDSLYILCKQADLVCKQEGAVRPALKNLMTFAIHFGLT